MSENQEEIPEDRGFQKLSSDDTLNEHAQSDNGHPAGEGEPRFREAQPSCAVCKDTLWLASNPTVPGRPPALVPCICRNVEDQRAARLDEYAQLGNLAERTFESLKTRGRRGRVNPDSFQRTVKTAESFADSPKGWLIVTGPVGSGKTHIAAAIANRIKSNGKPAKYRSATDLPDVVRRLNDFNQSEEAEGEWESIVESHVLVLDDFGVHHSSEAVDAKIEQLLTFRALDPLPTVIILAKPIEELPDHLRERFEDGELCTIAEIAPAIPTIDSDGRVPAAMLANMTFDSFDPDGSPAATRDERASLSIAFAAARRFADQPDGWLYLHGEVGVGKTHLAVAIAAQASTLGFTPTYWRLPDLLDKMRQGYSERSSDDFYKLFDAIKNAELLILDDFGLQTMTNWTLEKLYQLVAHRYERRLPTVTTSAYVIWNPEHMDGYHQRQEADYRNLHNKPLWESIVSRLRDSSVVTERLMSAPDYRNRGA